MTRRLGVHSHPAQGRGERGTMLFVHGAYVNSSCWDYHFIPFFQARGYHCYALDLAGHGASGGREHIHDFGIDDYADDVAAALTRIGQPTVLVGHSMGARVLERHLQRGGEARAAVLMAPVPTTGTAGSALQISLRCPNFFQVLEDAVAGRFTPQVAEVMARIYFAPDVAPEEIMQFEAMVGPESHRAVAEMALPVVGRPARRPDVPVLVQGGSEDAVFPASMLHFTAFPWHAEVSRVEGAGHMIMLDPQWEDGARQMLAWLERKEAA